MRGVHSLGLTSALTHIMASVGTPLLREARGSDTHEARSEYQVAKEWLERKLFEPGTQPRYSNHYFCRTDDTRWDAGWSCRVIDRCPTRSSPVAPFANNSQRGREQVINNQEVYDRAKVEED